MKLQIKDRTKIYGGIVLVASFLQTYLPNMKFAESTEAIIATVLFTIASIFTLKHQRASVEVDNKAVLLTWVLVGIIAFGGLNEIVGYSKLSSIDSDRLRSILAIAIGLLSSFSKTLFPTKEGEIIQTVTKKLEIDKKVADLEKKL